MGKMLTAEEIWEKAALIYVKKAAYIYARAAAGDLMESAFKGKIVYWRTELTTKRMSMGILSAVSMSSVVNAFIRNKQLKALTELRSQQANNYKTLINEGVIQKETDYGTINIDNGKKVWAMDAYGNVVREALILSYKADEQMSLTMPTIDDNGVVDKNATTNTPIKTYYRFFTDLAPEIIISTDKNIIQTTVQGRDRTRKELVSNGDITFSIKGNAVSNNMEAYPFAEVQKLINISQYGGIIDVNNIILDQFGIKKLLIKNLHFDKPICKNMQPYTLACVAIEPDEVMVTSDTIQLVDYAIGSNYKDGWADITNTVLQYTGINFSLADLTRATI